MENIIHTNSYRFESWYKSLMETSNKMKNTPNSYQPKRKNKKIHFMFSLILNKGKHWYELFLEKILSI